MSLEFEIPSKHDKELKKIEIKKEIANKELKTTIKYLFGYFMGHEFDLEFTVL